ncbi:hypothetical protein SORBI_3005G177400 [Sorghum bicolor]|uniref:GH18 domain-containing protein n=1 Tax=Sorghum bicolor TaxID=4558 RepID=C5Y5U8_SORBI|nr:hypothetical protein SORBI_3005G177400 [Sorghum bicolor]
MAFRWRLLVALVLVSLLALPLGSLAVADGLGDIAVFWGRNKSEGTLREACDTGAYNTVLISFLRAYSLDLSGHPLAGVGDDVKHCQSKGILVLLSIGPSAGAGADYSLPSPKSAADVAAYLWNAYLGGSYTGVRRPFGDAALDGVDFYIDQSSGAGAGDHYDELARRLYAYNSRRYRGRRLGVTLTASVRCAYPDTRLQAALATGKFARIHVRLYDSFNCTLFERENAERWLSEYPSSRVFVGVSAEDKLGGQIDMKDVYYDMLQFIEKLPNYGGLVIWNRYYDKKNHFISNS